MIKQILLTYIETLFSPKESITELEISIPPAGHDGDFGMPCFALAKSLGKNPVDIASQLADALSSHAHIQDARATGPFLNMTMSSAFYQNMVETYRLPSFTKNDQTVIVDYNQPNIGKPLHIAHLCTPSFGQPAINLLRYMGYTVYGDMHQGDWGGIFGKLIVAWEKWGDESKFATDPIEHLLDLYVQITAAAKEDTSIDQSTRDAFRKLSDADPEYVTLWKRFTSASLDAVDKALTPFGIHPDWKVGESFYEGLDLPKLGTWPDLKKPEQTMSYIVEELVEKGIATRNDDGSAGVVFPKETKIPSCILQKRDGTHGYLASDLAAIRYRMDNWSPGKILYFVDNRQALHFRQLFWVAQQAWGLDEDLLSHEQNGFVSLPDGAMSTRAGRIVRLGDLVDEAFSRTRAILTDRGHDLDDADISAISLGAIKYTFLSQDRERDWVFDWDRVLAFEGDSGPYVQYAIVRTQRLLSDLGDIGADISDTPIKLTPYDRALASDLIFFENQLLQCAKTFKFHSLVAYCYDVANHINSFYTNTDKLTAEEDIGLKTFRIQLLKKTISVLELAADILALPLPKKM